MSIGRIAISQRTDVTAKGERRDALDQAWPFLIASLGGVPMPVPNRLDDVAGYLEIIGANAILLTGGNDVLPDAPTHSPERNRTERAMLDWAAGRRLPALGVCRGFQMMNVALGGNLSPIEGHVAVPHNVVLDATTVPVNSFHNWGVKVSDLASVFAIKGKADDEWVEAAVHRDLPWVGVMWHPEREIPSAELHLAMVERALQGHGFHL